jgi:hypothetical protein
MAKTVACKVLDRAKSVDILGHVLSQDISLKSCSSANGQWPMATTSSQVITASRAMVAAGAAARCHHAPPRAKRYGLLVEVPDQRQMSRATRGALGQAHAILSADCKIAEEWDGWEMAPPDFKGLTDGIFGTKRSGFRNRVHACVFTVSAFARSLAHVCEQLLILNSIPQLSEYIMYLQTYVLGIHRKRRARTIIQYSIQSSMMLMYKY